MNAFVKILKDNGFKKVPWDRCPQGYQESNYQCFEHVYYNRWAEVYLSDPYPYVYIVGDGIAERLNYLGGQHINEPKDLENLFTKITS